MIIKRLYSSQEVVEGLHLVWDVFIRENASSCTQQGIEEFARFIKMENFMPLVESGEMIVFGAVEGQDLGGVGAVRRDGHISLLFVRPGSGTGSGKERDPFCSDGFDDIAGKCKIFL